MPRNPQWRLVARPQGLFKESDFRWVEEETPALQEGQALVRTILLSLDPTNRGWAAGDTYLPAVPLDSVMRGIAIGKVEESRAPGLAPGDVVQGLLGWQRYAVLPASNFWRRAASGAYDDEFASFVDYVGRAHTSRGADPHIYIPERYVIGMVGFVQHAISEALHFELHEIDPDLEDRAVRAWNLLAMVLLEMLSRAYGNERQAETFESLAPVQEEAVMQLALDAYERGVGIARPVEYLDVAVARADEIPEGERKIVQVEELSIGVFHHQGRWFALHNSCMHRGGIPRGGCAGVGGPSYTRPKPDQAVHLTLKWDSRELVPPAGGGIRAVVGLTKAPQPASIGPLCSA